MVLLDVDPGVGLGRVESRGVGADRLESESRAFHERVRYAFLDLAAADPKRYLVLDASRPAEEIGTAVTGRLAGILTAEDGAHPAPASTPVPPGPDFDAPDLLETDQPSSSDFAAPSVPAPGVPVPDVAARASGLSAEAATSAAEGDPSAELIPERSADREPPLEEMAELLGINDDDTPDSPPAPSSPKTY